MYRGFAASLRVESPGPTCSLAGSRYKVGACQTKPRGEVASPSNHMQTSQGILCFELQKNRVIATVGRGVVSGNRARAGTSLQLRRP